MTREEHRLLSVRAERAADHQRDAVRRRGRAIRSNACATSGRIGLPWRYASGPSYRRRSRTLGGPRPRAAELGLGLACMVMPRAADLDAARDVDADPHRRDRLPVRESDARARRAVRSRNALAASRPSAT